MKAAVIGAGGAIGRAFVACLAADARFETVFALSRMPAASALGTVVPGRIDVGAEDSIAAAAAAIPETLDLVIVATGLLHEEAQRPERALRELDAAWLARTYAVNTIGPALVLKHFAPKLPRTGRAVFAALSARVGSVSDNRTGGWYGYRASKAALNMVVRCAAIEIGRTRPEAVCVTLHPGTVDSPLSQPFQANVPDGKLFRPADTARDLLGVLDRLTPAETGRFFAWDGTEVLP